MMHEEFLEKFQDVLQTEEPLGMDTVLEDLAEWDSLARMATVAFLDSDFGVPATFEDFTAMKTVADVARKAGIAS